MTIRRLRAFLMLGVSLIGAPFAHLAQADPAGIPPTLGHSDSNNMHGDAYGSNVHSVRGPEHADSEVRSFRYGLVAGECAGFVFDSQGHIVTVCVKAFRSDVLVLDPRTLDVLARYRIPHRKGALLAAMTFRTERLFGDTSGGSYFYIDDHDRAVITTANRHVLMLAIRHGRRGRLRLVRDADFDLNAYVPGDCKRVPGRPRARCDKLTTALPDAQGLIWFITREGRVGTLDTGTGRVAVVRLVGEQIQNSFTVAADGVYLVSDHALYRWVADSMTGVPRVVYRVPYDRGERHKPGQVSQGSGTTPTLLDSPEGARYVIIADNAEPRLHVLVYRRDDGTQVCKTPVFTEGRSATENSLIAHGRSLVVENNYGYFNPFARKRNEPEGGFARIDIRPDESGCDVVWESRQVSPSVVAKLSVPSQLIYSYTELKKDWALTAIDFRTGETRFSIPMGTGKRADNSWASIVVGPLPGQACAGRLTGLTCVLDPRAGQE